MDIQVNYLAILLAAISTMVVGAIWYTPQVFGNKWMQWAKLDKAELDKAGPMPMVITFLVSLLTAYGMFHFIYISYQFFGGSYLTIALQTAAWLWLSFTAARIITHDAFEGRRRKLTLLTISHELVTFMVMGLILGLMK